MSELPSQIGPSRTKPRQIKPSKIAWFCSVLFVRIGTFQRVTADLNGFFPRFCSSLSPSLHGRGLHDLDPTMKARYHGLSCLYTFCSHFGKPKLPSPRKPRERLHRLLRCSDIEVRMHSRARQRALRRSQERPMVRVAEMPPDHQAEAVRRTRDENPRHAPFFLRRSDWPLLRPFSQSHRNH